MLFSDVYKQYFRCYPITQLAASEEKKAAANSGGKIYLPPSALNKLTMMRISYPMLFEIRSSDSKRITHGGVLEFIAPEGRVYLPEWMMLRLQLKTSALVEIRSTSLELGTFVKLEPQSTAFLDISDPKAVLENSLRNFSALTENDIFQITYNSTIYEIKVLEVKPETDKHSICVVETDLSVDFAPPVGYEETSTKKPRIGSAGQSAFSGSGSSIAGAGTSGLPQLPQNTESAKTYKAIVNERGQQGQGIRLSGKEVKVEVSAVDKSIYTDRDAPPLDLPEGQLFFGFPIVPVNEPTSDAQESLFKGAGQALRDKDKRKR